MQVSAGVRWTTLIVVQELRTRWTKDSRGGPAASVRNATPHAAVLPTVPASAGEAVLVQRVKFDEAGDFAPESSFELTSLSDLRKTTADLQVHLESGVVRVRYVWNQFCGAPERPHGRAIRIAQGSWCRILHNGRYGYAGSWSYQSTVVNIALGVIAPRTFLDTEPRESSDNRVELW